MKFISQAKMLPLEAHQIHVYVVDLDKLADQFDKLNHTEQQRAEQMPIALYRQRFVNARGYLRKLLAHYLALSAPEIKLLTAEKGKLFLADHPLFFNIAHSKNMAMMAFNYNYELGIDLEVPREMNDLDAIAQRVFSSTELEYLLSEQETKIGKFFKLWTRKEAVIKASGEGLSAPLTEITTTLADGTINPEIAELAALKLQLQDLPTENNCFSALAAHYQQREVMLYRDKS